MNEAHLTQIMLLSKQAGDTEDLVTQLAETSLEMLKSW